jgi:hypothetical protein
MRIWMLERTDFVSTTERRLATAAAMLVGGVLMTLALVGLCLVVLSTWTAVLPAVGDYYGADGAPDAPPDLRGHFVAAAAAFVVAFAGALVGVIAVAATYPPVAALRRETVPLKHLAPDRALEVRLPEGDAR